MARFVALRHTTNIHSLHAIHLFNEHTNYISKKVESENRIYTRHSEYNRIYSAANHHLYADDTQLSYHSQLWISLITSLTLKTL